jgi:predicted ATPase
MAETDFRATELDPDLLSTLFEVQTNWHVITGAASCGKTTLIDLLAEKGFQTVPETARLYIEAEMAQGRTMREIREDGAAFQRRLAEMQVAVERGLRAADVLFLDRGVPDCLAYCRVFGPNPNEVLAECFHHRYASVFMLDPLAFDRDGARDQDAHLAAYLHEWHARDYSALGYDIVRVPVLPPKARLAFVLDRIGLNQV